MAALLANAAEIAAFAMLSLALLICCKARWVGQQLHVVHAREAISPPVAPPVGGIAILIPLFLWVAFELLALVSNDPALQSMRTTLLLCGSGMAVIGLVDDQTRMRPWTRNLVPLVLVALALVMDAGLLTSTSRWSSFFSSSVGLSAYFIALSGLVVVLLNAARATDGPHGLLAGLLVIWSLCLWLSADPGTYGYLILLGTSAIVFAFSVKSGLSLGTCGSYGAVFVVALLSIRAHAVGAPPLGTLFVWFLIPVADGVRCSMARKLGLTSFNDDNDRLDRRLCRFLGGVHRGVIVYIGMVGAASIVATLRPDVAFVCAAIVSVAYGTVLWLTAPDSKVLATRHGHMRWTSP